MYEWFRAIHIIAVIAWMAGLLIYPRLLVYRLEAQGDERFEAAMDKAGASTRKVILDGSGGGIGIDGVTQLAARPATKARPRRERMIPGECSSKA